MLQNAATFVLPVTVLPTDVDHGWPTSCAECPVALAIQRALLRKFGSEAATYSWGVLVGVTEVRIESREYRDSYCAKLPMLVSCFITVFDALDSPAHPVIKQMVPPTFQLTFNLHHPVRVPA